MLGNDKMSMFENLLEKDGSASIHNRNLQLLSTEIFKINKGISSAIRKNLLESRAENPYDFQCAS